MKMTGFGYLEDRMMTPQMIDDFVETTRFAIDQDIHVNITINDRTGEMHRSLLRKWIKDL